MNTWHRPRKIRRRPGWKIYQSNLKKTNARKKKAKKIFRCAALLIFLVVCVYGITGRPLDSAVQAPNPQKKNIARHHPRPETVRRNLHIIGKKEVQALLRHEQFMNLTDKNFDINFDGRQFYIDTSIDPLLQNFIINMMNSQASRYIGIVAMSPRTGKILSMAGFDRNDSAHNPCTENIFPAASVFKIVTAAAAIEKCGFQSGSPIAYSGAKHTLYKSQIENKVKPWSNYITLQDSFAQSVNPVFGKLGVHYLGKNTLENYACAFGFNRNINFEIPVQPSVINISQDPYHWAEIASGFNRTTAISPLHGALMVSAVIANNGRLAEPSIVEQITDESGRILYKGRSVLLNQVIKPRTSSIVKNLMTETIRSGTCRKTFRGYQKDPVLSRLTIGGKTGSINSRVHEGRRFDWFVGFAEDKKGQEQIALSVVVAHEKYIGVKAKQYAKMVFKEYFRNYFFKLESRQRAETREKSKALHES